MDLTVINSLFIWSIILYNVRGELTPLGCNEGWDTGNQYCYMFITDKLVTMKQAEVECNRYDASLMYFDNIAEVVWYTNIVSKYPSPAYWLSLNDMNWAGPNNPGTGHWKWGMYEKADMTFLQWNKSPANDGMSNCGGINVAGNMSDVGCMSKQAYICNIERKGQNCPDKSWVQTDTDCYFASNTADVSQLVTWQKAVDICQKKGSGSHLLTVDDVNDQTFLQGYLPYVAKSTYLYWTGLKYTNNVWGWFNQAPYSTTFFKWASEPDNLAGQEDCAVVRYNGQISDRNCNVQQNYICKKNQVYADLSLNHGCGIWTRAGSKCVNFYAAPQSTWSDAKAQCTSLQGDLINVKDLDTMAWLSEQAGDPSIGLTYWTALNDRQTEGKYQWSDGSVVDPNVVAWNAEPNNFYGQEDCGKLLPQKYGFADAPCNEVAAPLCELDDVQSCPPLASGMWVKRNADFGDGYNCYLFGNYTTTDAGMTKSEAEIFCEGLASDSQYVPHLLVVDTQAEKQFVIQQMSSYQDNVMGFWTMLTDKGNVGFWSWGGKELVDSKLVNWIHEPDNSNPNNDCAYFSNGYFMVTDCKLKMGYICERSAYQPWNSASSAQVSIHIHSVCLFVVSMVLMKLF